MKNYKKKYQKLVVLSLCLISSYVLAACKQQAKTAIICGGGEGFTCPIGMFCNLGERCGGIDKYGECKYIPDDCPADEQVVCGCDDKVYTNACYANAAAVSVAYQGTCITKK